MKKDNWIKSNWFACLVSLLFLSFFIGEPALALLSNVFGVAQQTLKYLWREEPATTIECFVLIIGGWLALQRWHIHFHIESLRSDRVVFEKKMANVARQLCEVVGPIEMCRNYVQAGLPVRELVRDVVKPVLGDFHYVANNYYSEGNSAIVSTFTEAGLITSIDLSLMSRLEAAANAQRILFNMLVNDPDKYNEASLLSVINRGYKYLSEVRELLTEYQISTTYFYILMDNWLQRQWFHGRRAPMWFERQGDYRQFVQRMTDIKKRLDELKYDTEAQTKSEQE